MTSIENPLVVITCWPVIDEAGSRLDKLCQVFGSRRVCEDIRGRQRLLRKAIQSIDSIIVTADSQQRYGRVLFRAGRFR